MTAQAQIQYILDEEGQPISVIVPISSGAKLPQKEKRLI